MKETLTILIAEDHTLVREAWSFMLNSDSRFEVIAETSDGEKAVELAQLLQPDVVLLDISFGRLSDIEIAGIIRQQAPASRILGVATKPAHVRRLMQSGVMGCITKNSSSQEMFEAIMEICNGREYICTEIKNILAEIMISGRTDQARVNSLSAREIEVISHIKDGESSKEIAKELNISRKTIEVHRYNIMKKLGLKNVAALVNYVNNYQLELEERYAM